MAQTKAGARLAAARRMGMTVNEYEAMLAAGFRWCTRCKTAQPSDEFGSDTSRPDGLAAACRASRKAHYARTYVPRAKPGPRVITAEGRARMAENGRRRKGNQDRLGKKHTAESRAKMSATLRVRAARGDRVHSYKDGRVAERRGARFSAEYRRWRYDVYTRDGFTCRRCGDGRGGNLHAHHIKGFADHPDDRYVLSNGLTLCEPCHTAFHSGEWPIEEVVPYG